MMQSNNRMVTEDDFRKEEEPEKATPSPLFARKNSMRNKPCPCKSGKKFKNCCWSRFNKVTL